MVHWSNSTCEVHVFDAASGHRLQALAFNAKQVQIPWSSSLPLLSVSSQKAHPWIYGVGPATNGGSEGGLALGFCRIRVMCPSERSVVSTPAALAGDRNWRCSWTTCGRLAVADNRGRGSQASHPVCVCVMDGHSLKQIFTIKDWPNASSWASRGRAVYAHFPGRGICAKFHMQDNTWRAVTWITDTRLAWLQACYKGPFSPCGSMLVLSILEPNQLDLTHFDLKARCCHSIAECSCYAGSDDIRVAWIPHPVGWSPAYMIVDQPAVQGSMPPNQQVVLPFMKLVDAKAHRVLASWLTEVLKE